MSRRLLVVHSKDMKQRNGHRILAWALGGSLAIHLVFAVAVRSMPPAVADDTQPPRRVTITHIPHTPPPQTPTPTPRPQRQAATHAQTVIKRRVIATHLVVAHAHTNGPVVALPIPGPSTAVDAPGTADGSPAPAAPATTPKPACSNPNVAASAIDPVSPSIPDEAAGASGVAQVQVTLSPNGNVERTEIFRSTGIFALDRAALSAARMTTYRPEIRDCVPIGGSYLFTVTFES